jgi:hypothetical protein
MAPKGLKLILRRVQSWPITAQQEALKSLRAIEADLYDTEPVPQYGPASVPELEIEHEL